MTKEVQQLINQLEDDLLHASKEISTSRVDGRVNEYNYFIGFYSACNRCIDRLKISLNHNSAPNPATADKPKTR